jgi:hypothetical protein
MIGKTSTTIPAACALEAAIRSALSAHPAQYRLEAMSVCRHIAAGGRISYRVVFPDQLYTWALEPTFLTLTPNSGRTEKLLRQFRPEDFKRLQELVDSNATTVELAAMGAAVEHYNAVMRMPQWQRNREFFRSRSGTVAARKGGAA